MGCNILVVQKQPAGWKALEAVAVNRDAAIVFFTNGKYIDKSGEGPRRDLSRPGGV